MAPGGGEGWRGLPAALRWGNRQGRGRDGAEERDTRRGPSSSPHCGDPRALSPGNTRCGRRRESGCPGRLSFPGGRAGVTAARVGQQCKFIRRGWGFLPADGRLSAVIPVLSGGISLVCGNSRVLPPPPLLLSHPVGRTEGSWCYPGAPRGRTSTHFASGGVGSCRCSLSPRVKPVLVSVLGRSRLLPRWDCLLALHHPHPEQLLPGALLCGAPPGLA